MSYGTKNPIKYTAAVIADELDATAQGNAYYGNALRVAKDFDCLTSEDKSVLDRWATGAQTSEDRFELQAIAIKIRGPITQYYNDRKREY